MRFFGLMFSILMIPNLAWTSGIYVDCSNTGNTIRFTHPDYFAFEEGELSILIHKYNDKNEIDEKFVTFEASQVSLAPSERTKIKTEKFKCTETEYFWMKYTFVQKSGEPMPNAYNRLANSDGSLSDYFICKEVKSSICP